MTPACCSHHLTCSRLTNARLRNRKIDFRERKHDRPVPHGSRIQGVLHLVDDRATTGSLFEAVVVPERSVGAGRLHVREPEGRVPLLDAADPRHYRGP